MAEIFSTHPVMKKRIQALEVTDFPLIEPVTVAVAASKVEYI